MSGALEIRVPRETVNDDFVTVAEWRVRPGEKVHPGQVVVTVETSKALLELEAPREGYVEIVSPAGAEVKIGALLGRIVPQPPAGDLAPRLEPARPPETRAAISEKARALIEEHDLDPARFAERGMVRASDVVEHLEARRGGGAPERGAGGHAPVGLWGELRGAAARDGTSVLGMGLDYLFRTWLLGHLVRFAPRGVDLFLHRLRGVRMGRDCYIDPTAIVETSYPQNVSLGDDVRIAAGAVVMTHIIAPHYLRDTGIMPLVRKPVRLDDHSFIGANAVILPGVTVGRASVVASGAVVSTNVAPYTMVAGNPARVIKRFPNPPFPNPPEGSLRSSEPEIPSGS